MLVYRYCLDECIQVLPLDVSIQVKGVQEKLCFFHNSLQPPLAYIVVRDLQSSQRIASVQSLLLAGNFLYNQ